MSLTYSDQKSTRLSPEKATNNPYSYAHYFVKIRFNIFPVKLRFPK